MTTGQIVIGAEEAARTLNVAASTLAKWRVSGFGPRFVKLGRRIGYRLADIEAWVEKNLLAHTAEQPASTAMATQNPMPAVRVRQRPLR